MSDQPRSDPARRAPPGRIWYLIAILVFLAGIAGAGLLVYSKLDKLTQGMQQVVVPGEKVLTLEPGRYTIFHEYQSSVDGRIYSGTDVSGLLVHIQPVDGGAPIALEQPSASSSYALGGRAGRSVLAFEITQPGDYRLSAAYPEGEEKSEAVLAVSSGFTGRLLSLVFSAIGIGFAGAAAAVIIAVVTFRRRRKASAAT